MNLITLAMIEYMISVIVYHKSLGENKNMVWIQHPGIIDYFEYLMNQKAIYNKPRKSNTKKMFTRMLSLGNTKSNATITKGGGSFQALTSSSYEPGRLTKSDSANSRTAHSMPTENTLGSSSVSEERITRSSASTYTDMPSTEMYQILRTSWGQHESSRDSNAYVSVSGRTFSSSRRNISYFLQGSFIKKLKTPHKQELCDANLITFSLLEDDIEFPDLDELGSDRNWSPGDSIASSRRFYQIEQNFIDNLPIEKTKKGSTSFSIRKEEEYYKYSKMLTENKKEYVDIFVRRQAGMEKMEAIPCIVYEERSWFIVDGFAPDQYFTVERSLERETFRVTGLLEPMAEIEQRYFSLSPLRLERTFRESQKWAVKTNTRVNLCLLNDVDMFRLCCTVYAAWQQQLRSSNRKWNLARKFNAGACINNVILKSSEGENNYVSNIPVTLIPCAVNIDNPAFYITANESGLGAFIVTSPENNENFFLTMAIRHIGVLSNANAKYLIVESSIKFQQSVIDTERG